jgi:hypothetical protein
MDYVVLETEESEVESEGRGSECNSGGDCRRWVGYALHHLALLVRPRLRAQISWLIQFIRRTAFLLLFDSISFYFFAIIVISCGLRDATHNLFLYSSA